MERLMIFNQFREQAKHIKLQLRDVAELGIMAAVGQNNGCQCHSQKPGAFGTWTKT